MTNANNIHRSIFDCEQHEVNVLATPEKPATQILAHSADFVGFWPLIGIL